MKPKATARTPHLPILAAAFLALIGPGCSSTPDADEGKPAMPDAGSSAEGAKNDEKAHKIEMAQLGLDQARLEAEQGISKAELEVMLAEKKHKAAKEALQVFKRSKERRQAEAQLSLDQASGRAADSQAELEELEAMYADEEFAEKTKELVLSRGRRNLDHARRGLEIQEQKLQQLAEYELPKEQYEKEMAVTEAEQKVAQAQRSLELARLKGKSSVAKAEHALSKATTDKKDEA